LFQGFAPLGPKVGCALKQPKTLVTCSIDKGKKHSDNRNKPSVEFTRYLERRDGTAALQTAVVSYRLPSAAGSTSNSSHETGHHVHVDVVTAVHIGDGPYFAELQDRLHSYDRVLYEMVADTSSAPEGQRWRPPPPPKNRKYKLRPSVTSLVGLFQRNMARFLQLEFQGLRMDYSGDKWYHADLDLNTFHTLSNERQESFWTLGKRMTKIVKATVFTGRDDNDKTSQWETALVLVPMPLFVQLVITGHINNSSSDSQEAAVPLGAKPMTSAFLNLDFACGCKHVLAQQLSSKSLTGFFEGDDIGQSVIIGERNAAAMSAVQGALDDGCQRIAIFYGGAHLPDLEQRLMAAYDAEYVGKEWMNAWDLPSSHKPKENGRISILNSIAAQEDHMPLSLGAIQTVGLLALSFLLATDLYIWEVLVKFVAHGVVQVATDTYPLILEMYEETYPLFLEL